MHDELIKPPALAGAAPLPERSPWWLAWRQLRVGALVRRPGGSVRLAAELCVLPMYREGRPLAREDIVAAVALRGLVLIEDVGDERPQRIARLRDARRYSDELLPPLWNPSPLRIAASGVLLAGFEGGVLRQAWWLRMPV